MPSSASLPAHSLDETNLRQCIAQAPTAEEQASAILALGRWCQTRHRFAEAESHYRQCIDVRPVRALALARLGEVYHQTGRVEHAIECYQQALTLWKVEPPIPPEIEAETLNNLGGAYQGRGQQEEAVRCFQRGLEIRRSHGDLAGQGRILNNLGIVYAQRRDWARAEQVYRDSLALKQQLGDRIGEGQTMQNLALLRDAQGDGAGALELQRRAVSILRISGDSESKAIAQSLLARLERGMVAST